MLISVIKLPNGVENKICCTAIRFCGLCQQGRVFWEQSSDDIIVSENCTYVGCTNVKLVYPLFVIDGNIIFLLVMVSLFNTLEESNKERHVLLVFLT